jgi:hypothetical protein
MGKLLVSLEKQRIGTSEMPILKTRMHEGDMFNKRTKIHDVVVSVNGKPIGKLKGIMMKPIEDIKALNREVPDYVFPSENGMPVFRQLAPLMDLSLAEKMLDQAQIKIRYENPFKDEKE